MTQIAIDSDAQPADALVVFGATGDLAHKKIFPALYAMRQCGALKAPVIGYARDPCRRVGQHLVPSAAPYP